MRFVSGADVRCMQLLPLCPRANRRSTSGFTLVEILIVVIILGVLASIVVPRFTNATDNAKYSSLKNTVKIVRGQLQMYQTQHSDWPDLTGSDGWNLLIQKTDEDGTLNANGQYGPYLQKIPANAFTGGSTISTDESDVQDWLYNPATGEFKAFMGDTEYDRLSVDDPDIVIYIVPPPST